MNYKFILRTDQQKNGQAPLYCRGYFDRKKKDISLKIYLKKGQFDENRAVIKGHPEEKVLNLVLEKIKFRMSQETLNCELNESDFTPELFEQIVKGKVTNRNSFYEFALNEINNSEEHSAQTKKTYLTQVSKMKLFRPELTWKELNLDFIEKYKNYMIKTLHNNENTYYKSLTFIKSMINRGIRKGHVKENLFRNITLKKIQGKREFLDIEDLKVLEELYQTGKLVRHRQNVLQYFLFSCYTGLRYMDIKQIRHGDIRNSIIQITMHKTKDNVRIPVIEKARALIVPGEPGERIFKVITNQKTNDFLKEIMVIANINKKISFHCARHTFATVGLTVGIPIEVISKLLGHRDLKTTQIYAKVIDTLKIKEMKKFNSLF